jgi:hypothetical protein
MDDENPYFGFWCSLAIAVAPALVEHVLAPILIRQVDPADVVKKPDTPAKKRGRAKAVARGFAAFVAFEKRST